MNYLIENRVNQEIIDITEVEAHAITGPADIHAGPFGWMGLGIDQVLWQEDSDDHPVVKAVRYEGKWLAIPASQAPFISHELSANEYDDLPYV